MNKYMMLTTVMGFTFFSLRAEEEPTFDPQEQMSICRQKLQEYKDEIESRYSFLSKYRYQLPEDKWKIIENIYELNRVDLNELCKLKNYANQLRYARETTIGLMYLEAFSNKQ